jgi:hypothetical protein
MAANEKPPEPKRVSQIEYNAMTAEDQRERVNQLNAWDDWHDKQRRKVVTAECIAKSFKRLTPIMLEMPKAEKIPAFLEILIANKISKWELAVATNEILRSRVKMEVVAEYFHALNRVKENMARQNHNVFHENALDF